MKTIVLSANLGKFDTPHEPSTQTISCDYYCWDDISFPPIAGLTPRLQYRIPKTHGWQMKPGYDYYLWLDGSMSLQREDSLKWYLDQLGDNDMGFFKHPVRRNIRQEVEHIEEKLAQNNWYITPRYGNGLHRELLEEVLRTGYKDDKLYASTIFIYKDSPKVRNMLIEWLYHSVRYFTCDQVGLPYLLHKYQIKVATFDEPLFKSGHSVLVSHHK